MIDSLAEAVDCAEAALSRTDETRFALLASLMRFLDVRAESCLVNEAWGPETGAAGLRLGRHLLELGLRQEAERMFRLLAERLDRYGVPESEWGEQGEPFVNCLGVLGISLGQQTAARAVLRCARLDGEPRLSPAAVATRVNLAAAEAGLGNVDPAVDHALAARAMLERLPESDAPAVRELSTVLDAVEHQLLGFAPRYGDHCTRALYTLAQHTGRKLDGLDRSDPRAFLAVANFALARAGAAVEAGDTDDLETVVKVLEVAAQRLATLLGADHPKALGVQADLAAVQIEAARAVRSPDRLDRAVRLLGATAQRLEIRLGPAHPRTVAALTNLVAAQVEMVRALPAPGKAQRTADALAERALQFGELLGKRHPVTRLVSASAATCRRMAAGDEDGRDIGGTTLVRTLVDWQEDGEVYRSFREAVGALGRPPTPGDGTVASNVRIVPFHGPRSASGGVGYPLGALVRGVVSEIDQHEVEVEVGDIDRGVVLRHSLPDPDIGHPSELVAYGDELEAVVIGCEQGYEGRLLLSMREPLWEEARRRRTLAASVGLASDGVTVSGRVLEVVAEGLAVEVGSGTALLPTADIEEGPVRDPQRYVGQILDAKAWVHRSGSVLLSRRAWLEEAEKLRPQEWLAHVQVGHVRTGRVTGVQSQDVVVNLGSFRGLLDLADLETGRVAVGDLVTARISAVDRSGGQVYLELIEGEKTSWQRFTETHRAGRIVRGTVVETASNGLFLRVADGVRGWVDFDELADDQIASNMLAVGSGEDIFVRIVSVDPERCWVVLSAREADAALGADPASAEFAPELYADAPDFDDATARNIFERHRQNLMERRTTD
ncbi:S1 RNA-binding domain-containing protein [Streptomyces sp. NBC_00289]|uniref:S1 RNA-binding domain-containing protein n=1 Tax=Streptomyces sp. NBC_00289 TaxID=2975703 RepID=UPI00324AA5AE